MAGINHVAVKSTGDKGLVSEWNDDHEQKGNHDCAQFQHLNHVIENRTDYPAGPVKGQIIFRTDIGYPFIWDGAQWAVINIGKLILHGRIAFGQLAGTRGPYNWNHGGPGEPDFVFITLENHPNMGDPDLGSGVIVKDGAKVQAQVWNKSAVNYTGFINFQGVWLYD